MKKPKKTPPPTKDYFVLWLDDEGEQHYIDRITTHDPRQSLFVETCKMIIRLPSRFHPIDKTEDHIPSLIRKGSSSREHWFIEMNGQMLSVIEADYVAPEGDYDDDGCEDS